MKKITVEQVAPIMGRCPQGVRVGLQKGMYPFGVAYKKDGSEQYTYDIFPKKFYEYYGELPEGIVLSEELTKEGDK